MRLACLTLVALYLLAAPAAAQPAWVIAYEQGVEAFNRGNDAVAETKLLEARERGPRQSRKASFGGLNLAPFIPDYYLGLIAARTGRHAEGIRLLEGALAQGLISQREEREFTACQRRHHQGPGGRGACGRQAAGLASRVPAGDVCGRSGAQGQALR